MISVKEVRKTFTTAAGKFEALKGINLSIGKGEFAAVIGKSGSGKTTLMNMLAGIDKPTSGELYVSEKAVHTMTENQLSKWRGRNVGIVFQFFQLLPTLSVIENIMLPMDFCNNYAMSERKEIAIKLLKQLDLEDQAYKFPAALSGGQQQRAAIARALANDPPILLADEPTGNLDTATANEVFSLFKQLSQTGKTIILVTHDQDIAGRCSRIIKLADGNIVQEV